MKRLFLLTVLLCSTMTLYAGHITSLGLSPDLYVPYTGATGIFTTAYQIKTTSGVAIDGNVIIGGGTASGKSLTINSDGAGVNINDMSSGNGVSIYADNGNGWVGSASNTGFDIGVGGTPYITLGTLANKSITIPQTSSFSIVNPIVAIANKSYDLTTTTGSISMFLEGGSFVATTSTGMGVAFITGSTITFTSAQAKEILAPTTSDGIFDLQMLDGTSVLNNDITVAQNTTVSTVVTSTRTIPANSIVILKCKQSGGGTGLGVYLKYWKVVGQ